MRSSSHLWASRVGLVALAWLALLTPLARVAEASPEDVFGYGARSPAMGGLGAAAGSGYEAAYGNPALLSRLRERGLTVGFQGATFALDAAGAGAGLPARLSYAPVKGTVIGAELPLPFGGPLRDRIGLALAFYTPTSVVVRGRILYPDKPQFPILPDRAQSVALRVGLGADVGYGLRVGAGFAALAEIVGSAVIATDATGRVGSRVEDQLVATYAPIFGVTYELGSRESSVTRFGLVYRGTLEARFAVVIDATRLSSLNLPLFNISGLAQYDPSQIGAEIARESGPWLFGIGATYKRWSAYPGPIEPTIMCPADSPECGAIKPPAVAWSDTLVVRVGGDRAFDAAPGLTVHLRAGAFFEPSPLPSELPSSKAWNDARAEVEEVPTRYFDASRVALTLGAGLELAKPLPPVNLDMFAQYHALVPRTVGGAEVSGRVLAGGLNAGVRF